MQIDRKTLYLMACLAKYSIDPGLFFANKTRKRKPQDSYEKTMMRVYDVANELMNALKSGRDIVIPAGSVLLIFDELLPRGDHANRS